MRLDGIELPEGLSAKLVATLVQRQSKEYWTQTKGYFEDHPTPASSTMSASCAGAC
ncbi:MAG: hypothetical protein SFX73_21200 [Kofleriaceae bacterium]|nr:hypothetical protein [Kofleriaceae bacterium]